MSKLEKVLDKDKKFKDYAEKHSHDYADIERALGIVKAFIIKKRRILYGGMAIDLSLKAKKHKGIYKEDAIPDYDFMSPTPFEDSIELAKILHKEKFENVSSIGAFHVTTRRVRINFVPVADITYIPPEIYRDIPTVKHSGLLVVHPDFQRLDMHRAMCYPFENPPMEVVLHRGNKDQKRFRLLAEQYPICLPKRVECVKPTKMKWGVPKKYLVGNVIGGTQAYCFTRWILGEMLAGRGPLGKIAKAVPNLAQLEKDLNKLSPGAKVVDKGNSLEFELDFSCVRLWPITITSNKVAELAESIDKKQRHYNSYLDDLRPETIIAKNYELFNNHPKHLPTFELANVLKLAGSDVKATDIRVCTTPNILLYFLQKYFGGGFDLKSGSLDKKKRHNVYIKMYLAVTNMVVVAEKLLAALREATPNAKVDDLFRELPFFLSTNMYGTDNWAPSYIVMSRTQRYMADYTPAAEREVFKPPNYYPATYVGPDPTFDLTKSEFFQFNGQEIKK